MDEPPFCLVDVAPGRVLALAGRLDVAAAADARLALARAVDDGDGELHVTRLDRVLRQR